jgi:hypothetical protein
MVAGRVLNFRLALLLIFAVMLLASPRALAHDESIPCVLDLVIYPDHAEAELKFPTLSLLAADAWADTTHPNMVMQPVDIATIDRDAYVKKKAEQIMQGLLISFDGTDLKPRLINSSAEDLVLSANEDDTEPRPVAIYQLEYALPHPQPPVKLVTVRHDLLPAPNDGSNVQVVCLINRKQNDRKGPYPVYIANDDKMTMKCDWTPLATAAPSAKPASAPSAVIASATTQPTTQTTADDGSPRNKVATIYLAAAVALVSAAVWGWAKVSRR